MRFKIGGLILLLVAGGTYAASYFGWGLPDTTATELKKREIYARAGSARVIGVGGGGYRYGK